MGQKLRKIIHVDMDCFYAAIEIRDNPALADKPVAVGGSPEQRSVLCTCNYIARKYGIRSAMPSSFAKRLCPELIILPVDMNKYREASHIIQQIFLEYTALVEPLSLDEAYLDVTQSTHCQGSATWIATEIRQKIWDAVQLTASAGIAPNKFLAKIASGWNKPNGQFVIPPEKIASFIKVLPVKELFGVGKITAEKLHQAGLKTCGDIQQLSQDQLLRQFGKLGNQLYEQSRGIDHRAVEPNRERKSLSVERTFIEDIKMSEDINEIIADLFTDLTERIQKRAADRKIKNVYIKVKSHDFKVSTLERSSTELSLEIVNHLFKQFFKKENYFIRLLGIGVHFVNSDNSLSQDTQQSLL
jgi:DNA polymerase-4